MLYRDITNNYNQNIEPNWGIPVTDRTTSASSSPPTHTFCFPARTFEAAARPPCDTAEATAAEAEAASSPSALSLSRPYLAASKLVLSLCHPEYFHLK